MNAVIQALADGGVVAKRNLIKVKRISDLVVFSTLSAIVFVLLFTFVLGGSITVSGVDYHEFLMAGIFAQAMIIGTTITGAGLAQDLQDGIIDRFRSLPMARSAVVIGRTASDVVNNAISLVVMAITGWFVGWRIHSAWWQALAGFGSLLLFAYAVSWIMAFAGLLARNQQVFTYVSYGVVLPVTFVANTFVQEDKLPGPLRGLAEWNPTSAATQAVRELFGNSSPLQSVPTVWPLRHPVLATLGWTVILLLVFVPLAIWQYRRSGTRQPSRK